MEVEILSTKLSWGFNTLIAPVEVCRDCVEDYINNYRFLTLYICGNRSQVLGKIRGKIWVKRGFTIYQLIKILLDAYEDVLFVEHDPMVAEEIEFSDVEDFALLLRQVGREKLLIYFSSARDQFFDLIANYADRLIWVEEDARCYRVFDVSREGVRESIYLKDPLQLTLEIF